MEGHSPRCICLLCVLRRTSKHHKLVVPCRFNLLNSCKFSCDECRFTHYEYDEIPPCRNGVKCRFGPTKCLFLHDSFEGDGDTVENLPQNNTEHAAKEQPAGTIKKKKRKKKQKKNNNKSRLVESKQDSQSSQNPFQPLLVEEIEDAESDSESEGESESDSPSETNQVSSPLANVVDEPSPVSKSSPFEEVTDSVNTPSSENYSNLEEKVKVADEIEFPSSLPETNIAQPDIEVTPDTKSPEVEDSKEEDYSPNLELYCSICDQVYVYFTYLNSFNRPSRHYVLESHCSDCGRNFQNDPYWGHNQNRAGAICKCKDIKYCQACTDRRLI